MHKLFSLTSAKFKRAICLFLVMANIFCSYGVLLAEEIGDTSETTLTEETSQETEGSENPATADTGVQPSVTPVPTPTAIPDVSGSDDIVPSGITIRNASGSGYMVTVSYGPETGIPADAELVVTEIPAGDVYDEYLDMASGALNIDDIRYARLFDISLIKDGSEIEPAEGTAVAVKIVLTDAKDRNLSVVHLPEGSDAEVVDASCSNVRQGTELTFDADGFSAYAIVEGPEKQDPPVAQKADDISDLTGEDASMGFYMSIKGKSWNYVSNSLNGNGAFIEVDSTSQASPMFFEKKDENSDLYYIYTIVDGERKYIKANSNNKASLVNKNQAAEFSVTMTDNCFRFTTVSSTEDINNKTLQHSNGGNGVRFHGDQNDNGLFALTFVNSCSFTTDVYGLDGKTYGLMYYNGGTAGKGLLSEPVPYPNLDSSERTNAKSMTVLSMADNHDDKIFVPNDSDIAMWTFHWDNDDKYTISTVVNGATKYMNIDSTGVTVSDVAQQIKVVPGTGNNRGQLILQNGSNVLTYSGDISSGFTVNGEAKYRWLNLVDLSEFTSDYFLTYSANKVSVSDTEHVPDGSKVILYTRFWNESKKRYEFYAVDYDGSLIRCYEDGDTIEWVDNGINTLLWDFTEYIDSSTGKPSGYYELYNEYSQKFIAPQYTDDQITASGKIGINLPGRTANDKYYTPILAWDESYYSYVGLKVEEVNGGLQLVLCSKDEADDFYFAILQDVFVDEVLHEVPTIDNNIYGIKMKMKDFKTRAEMSDFLGSDEGGLGTKLHQGLLSTNLDEYGYPTVTGGVHKDESLSHLFTDYSTDNPFNEVNHLFIESIYKGSGYFEFDSSQNYATLKNDPNNFMVFQELGSYDSGGSKPSLKHGQFFPYDDIEPGHFAKTNGYNLYDAVGTALPVDNPRYNERLHLIDEVDCYFGMELETSFVQTPSGRDDWGHDIIYEFTGDDDFWLYVDGELLIDLGGIHSAVAGSINYCTGEVEVNGKHTTLREVFRANYKGRNMSDADIEAKLDSIFESNDNVHYTFKDYTFHTMKIFYMERGAGASNLHMRFNQSSVKPGTVVLSKDIGMDDGGNARDLLTSEFPFQIIYFLPDPTNPDHPYIDEPIILPGDGAYGVYYQGTTKKVTYEREVTINGEVYQGVFYLKPGEMIEINLPDDAIFYQIKECGVNDFIYDEIYVNGELVPPDKHTTASGTTSDYLLDRQSVEDRTTVKFVNHVDPDAIRTLTLKKILLDENGQREIHYSEDPSTFDFRLYIGSETDNEPQLCNMYEYHVKDEDGYYCRWNADLQKFESVGIKDYLDLSDSQRKQVTFTTSMYGSISKIPAFYTVEVKGLLVGNKYMVEERPWETPDGYSFNHYVHYTDVTDTSTGTSMDNPPTGSLVEGKDPHVDIVNYKGYGIRVNKNWTDDDYVESHPDTYFAVYSGPDEDNLTLVESINGEPVNTVRCLRSGESSLYWYFEHLDNASNYNLNNYYVREVKISGSNPTVDSNGVVTDYGVVTPIDEGGHIKLFGRIKGETVDPYEIQYTVNYERGAWSAGESMRVDTVTNDRPGILIYKNDWEWDPLKDSTFTLRNGSGMVIGNYVSDDNGYVTKVFLPPNTNYQLIESSAPSGYQGLPSGMVLSLDGNEQLVISGVDSEFYRYDPDTQILDIRNKHMLFGMIKTDEDGNPLENAHFRLHKKVSVGGFNEFDPVAVPGFHDVVTGVDGIVPGINQDLIPGEYRIREITPPPGFASLPNGVTFNIDKTGIITLTGNTSEDVSLTKNDDNGTVQYILSVKNHVNSSALTITKTVYGNMGNRNKGFDVTVTLRDSSDNPYVGNITKTNGTVSETITPDSSGVVTFTISHGDTIVLNDLPSGTKFTVTEDNENYSAKCYLDNVEQADDNSASGILRGDMTVHFDNTLNSVIPTGLETSFNLSVSILCAMAAGLVVSMVYGYRKRRRYADYEE